jgi:polysaccharide biosynthesis protein PslJ
MTSRTDTVAGIAIVVVCPVIAALTVLGGMPAKMAVAGVIALTVGVYVGLRHPLWLYWALAAVLGAVPFGYFPGVHVPMYLAFAGAVVLAALIHPTAQMPYHRLEKTVVLLVLVSGLSLVFTLRSVVDPIAYIKWTICTLAFIALLRLPREQLATFGRVFVYAAAANGLFGITMVVADPEQKLMRILRPFGYGVGTGLRANTQLFAFAEGGQWARLGGTWVLPNSAGLCLAVALAMCVILFKGFQRVAIAAVLLVAIGLTLSRSALIAVVAGVLIVLLFHGMRARNRGIAIGLCGLAGAGSLVVPQVRDRVFSSFGSSDTGSTARLSALANFPDAMAGHWWFGAGWGRPEFTSGEAAHALSFDLPSNAPLLAAYRGGIFVGLVFAAVLVMACVIGYRAVRSDSLPFALHGGLVIGICLLTLQLDKSVVDPPAITLTFSVLLAFLVYVDEARRVKRHADWHTRDLVASPSN